MCVCVCLYVCLSLKITVSLHQSKLPTAVVQPLRHVWLFATPWTAACQASQSFTSSQSLLKFMSIKLVMPSNHLILCCPLFLSPPSFPESGSFLMNQLYAPGGQSTGASASSSVLPKNIQDWFPLGFTESPTLTSIHNYCKNIPLTRWTSFGQVMSLPFNMLSRLVIAFLPRSKHLLISWL